jgi:hypothetical protein
MKKKIQKIKQEFFDIVDINEKVWWRILNVYLLLK